MELGLAGKVAVVTGASKGIGLAVTEALVAAGAQVVAGARTLTPELERLAAEGSVQAVPIDLGSPEGPARLVAASAHFGGLDIVVNNVGAVSPRLNGFLEISEEDWAHTWNLDVMATVRTIKAAVPLLLARGGGNVVTIASVNAYLPDPGVLDYSAAKAAVWNISKSLSKEYGPQRIRFNTVSPGPVATDLWLGSEGFAATIAKASGTDFDTARDTAIAAQGGFSTGRFTTPEEVADLVLLLASGRAGNVTGSDFMIDGGLVKGL
jgi:NAD(P)-dependent dehydrogenase (short-subunit alcohol dehydrogenase family)